MRIDAYTQVQQVYNSSKPQKMQKGSKTGFKDQLQISSKGKDIQTAKQAVDSAPDVREEVVAPIKSAIDAGTYQVSGESFADRLFEKYNSANLGSF